MIGLHYSSWGTNLAAARGGDRILLSCGEYRTAFADGAAEERSGVALLLPFKDVEPFVAEPKE